MSTAPLIVMPRQIANAISDLLDVCAEIKPDQQVLIVAAPDGLSGGWNVVDETTVAWIQSAVQQRGAWASVLWTDVPERVHAWRIPPVLKAALAGADIIINHAFDLPFEELYELRDAASENRVTVVRNMATTANLLASDWAQTPYELVSAIRLRTAQLFNEGVRWTLTHPNGTNLTGTVSPPIPRGRLYADRRSDGFYRPFPEGVFSPINILETEGTLVFEKTSPWWARYIGIPCHFTSPVRLTVENNRIKSFAGGGEAKAMERFIADMADRVGASMYETFALHGGVHPRARISSHQCPNDNYRDFIEHHDSSNLHLHLGFVPAERRKEYPYFVHITGDLQGATLRVDDHLVYDRGRLKTLDLEEIKSIAARYPDRPGI
jgi:hypothetical protein